MRLWQVTPATDLADACRRCGTRGRRHADMAFGIPRTVCTDILSKWSAGVRRRIRSNGPVPATATIRAGWGTGGKLPLKNGTRRIDRIQFQRARNPFRARELGPAILPVTLG